ncbi:MAG TPA: hypothetical protein VGP96_13345 [Candidatus Dormibacteraeota bacterium]|nr:hypothetical protein [Candidatus Dormibacteraeota bacterium]
MLARRWTAAGHRITLGSRDPASKGDDLGPGHVAGCSRSAPTNSTSTSSWNRDNPSTVTKRSPYANQMPPVRTARPH